MKTQVGYYSLKNHKPQTPPTHKEALLKAWAQDTEKLARMLIEYAMQNEYYYDGLDGQRLRGDWETALAGEIAYLNSAAEVGK